MAVAVASAVPFPCSDSPAEYRAPLAFSAFPAPPVRVRRDSGVMVAPAAFSVHRTQGSPVIEMDAMTKSGGDESVSEEGVMTCAETESLPPVASRKRTMRDEDDAEEQVASEERETKKRRVTGGVTLFDLKVKLVIPPVEPKPAPVVEFEPTVVDESDTAELDRQIKQIEKDLAEAMQQLKSAPRAPSPEPAPRNKPVRPSPLKSFTVTKPGMQISQVPKSASGSGATRTPTAPAPIVPPSLSVPIVDKATRSTNVAPSPPTTPVRRSRRLSSLPPVEAKPRRCSPPPRDSLYRQAIINRMRIASREDDFGSACFSPPSASASLPCTSNEDVDMEPVDTDDRGKTPAPEPVDPRLYPRQGCLKQMKAEHEQRRRSREIDSDLHWLAAKLQWEMEIAKKTAGKRRRG